MIYHACWGVWTLAGALTALMYAVVAPGSAWCGVFAVSVGLLVYVGENWELNRELVEKEERVKDLTNDVGALKRTLVTLSEERYVLQMRVWQLEPGGDGKRMSPGHKLKARRGLRGESCSSF